MSANDALRGHLTEARDALENITGGIVGTIPATKARAHVRRALDELDSLTTDDTTPISGAAARELPEHSIVVRSNNYGVPRSAYMPIKVRDLDRNDGGMWFRVLYRAPDKPLKLGERIHRAERLDDAKTGTILRWPSSDIRVLNANKRWSAPGSSVAVGSRDLNMTAGPTVIYVPEESS